MKTCITILVCRKYAVDNKILKGKYFLTPETELSEEGLTEIKNALERMNFKDNVKVFYSSYYSALQAKHLVREKLSLDLLSNQVDFEKDYRLVEQNFGTFGKQCFKKCKYVTQKINDEISEKERKYDFYTRFPDGESALDVYTRLSTFVTSKLEKEIERGTRNVIIITHEHVAQLLIRYLFDVAVCNLPSYIFYNEKGKYII